jgi:capsular polysaccharide biosynthesis protein
LGEAVDRPPACSIAFEEQTTTVSDIEEAERVSGPDLKVYLYRRPGTIPTEGLQVGRDFDNIDALGRLLLDNGFIAFDPGAVPLPEIVPLLQHAKQVVSVHGAGLANVLFCRPGTRVFEIRSPWGAWRSLEALSTVLGHDFTALQQSLPDDAEIPRIDLDELIALL